MSNKFIFISVTLIILIIIFRIFVGAFRKRSVGSDDEKIKDEPCVEKRINSSDEGRPTTESVNHKVFTPETPVQETATQISERGSQEVCDSKLAETETSVEEAPSQSPKRRPPEKRGGSPRGPRDKDNAESNQSHITRASNRDLICRKQGAQWIIEYENGSEFSEPDIGGEGFLLFKLNQDRGRRVKRASKGWYLVVGPTSWNRHEDVAGTPPVEPEPVCLDGYRAHFFLLNDSESTKIAFKNGDEVVLVGSSAPGFKLVGLELCDASDKGPLFGNEPPSIEVEDGHPEAVNKVVVGEEGGGTGRFKRSFQPGNDNSEMKIPTDIARQLVAGWYFIRFYDPQDALIDSQDFRFARGLKEIKIIRNSSLPSEDGHEQAIVEFRHDNGWFVEPLDGASNDVRIEQGSEKTTLYVPPTAKCDQTTWSCKREGGPAVEVGILVDRVWWAVGEETQTPEEWMSRPVCVPRFDFNALSTKTIWFRFPRPQWTEDICVGFRADRRRRYQVSTRERTLAIPFRDFSDAEEVANGEQQSVWRIWIGRNGDLDSAQVLIIPADTPLELPDTLLELRPDDAVRLARVVSRLRRMAPGRYRRMLKEVRSHYRRGRDNSPFAKEALCAVAIVVAKQSGRHTPILKRAKRWQTKAQTAARQFPDIMHRLEELC